jgi:DNA repair exonuclease SbcCD ATPase subunit
MEAIKKAGNRCTACGQKTNKNKKLLTGLKSKANDLDILCKNLINKGIKLKDKINASNKKVLNKVSTLKAALKILEDSKELHIGKLNTIIALESNLRDLKDELKELKSYKKVNLNKIKEKVDLAYQDYLQLSNQLKPLDEQLADVRWLIKEPLSNSGLKAFIFDTMLAKINNYLDN